MLNDFRNHYWHKIMLLRTFYIDYFEVFLPFTHENACLFLEKCQHELHFCKIYCPFIDLNHFYSYQMKAYDSRISELFLLFLYVA